MRRALAFVSRSRWMQRRLQRWSDEARWALGIGAGGHPPESGERALVRLLPDLGTPPYRMIDGGANRGIFLRLVVEELGRGRVRIDAFEPAAAAFAELERWTAGDEEILAVRAGLGAAAGEATLHAEAPGSGRASLTRLDLEHRGLVFEHAEGVRLTTVDDHCRRRGIDRLHLLKLDLEGHEMEALEGARGMLERGSVDLTSFEVGKANVDTRRLLKDYFRFFLPLGLRLYRVLPSERFLPMPVYRERDEHFETANYLALRPETAAHLGLPAR